MYDASVFVAVAIDQFAMDAIWLPWGRMLRLPFKRVFLLNVENRRLYAPALRIVPCTGSGWTV